MGRVMGCGLCPYNAIEKVGNYEVRIVKKFLNIAHHAWLVLE